MRRLLAAAAAPTGFDIKDPIGATDLAGLIKVLTDAIRNLAIPVAVVMILVSGFYFLTAGGNPTRIQTGKKMLMYTAIGLAIIFIGGGFVDLIKSVIGTNSEVQQIPVQNRPGLNQLTQ